jgi:hypothetical protein
LSTPVLFFGERGGNHLLLGEHGHTDAGAAIVARARPNEMAPAGQGGECLFAALYLTVSHSMATTLRVVPILDGERLEDMAKVIELPELERRTTLPPMELPLLRDAKRLDGTVWGRFALRGTWFSFTCDTPAGIGEGDLLIEAAEVEVEIVRETKRPAA